MSKIRPSAPRSIVVKSQTGRQTEQRFKQNPRHTADTGEGKDCDGKK
jgi:hypothetical protein